MLVVFGGSKDVGFNQEISDLVGQTRVPRTSWQTGRTGGRTTSGDDIAILRAEDIRQLPERQALVVAENGRPIIARLTRCIDGHHGRTLLDRQRQLRQQLLDQKSQDQVPEVLAQAAVLEAQRHGLTPSQTDLR